nr:hypothetical protein [Rhizobium sp. Root1203]
MVNPGGINLHEMRIAFDVTRDISSSANSATITIYNLSESHRNSIGKVFDNITLEAGYLPPEGGGNVGIIFKGAVRDVQHTREEQDTLTTITCGDGAKALRKATISKSYQKGTRVGDVLDDIYSEMEKQGISRGEWKLPDDMKEKTFKRPYAVCGLCSDEMDTLGRGHGFYWSSQNEVLEIVPGDGVIGGVVLITPETGMIGAPTITDNGVRVTAMLNPEVRPNRRVQVKSETLEMNAADGMYRVSEVTFSGDNGTGAFQMALECEAVKGGKVDQGLPK